MSALFYPIARVVPVAGGIVADEEEVASAIVYYLRASRENLYLVFVVVLPVG
jgi:hypothetical protein